MAEETGSSPKNFDDDGRHQRTGTVWTACVRFISSVISMGPGVLALPWAIAQLGWLGGSAFMVLYCVINCFFSTLLTGCYRSGDPVVGERNYSYMGAMGSYLGTNKVKACALLYHVTLCALCIAYTVQGSTSMMALKKSSCFHKNGAQYPCHINNNIFMILFGVTQIILSEVPKVGQLCRLYLSIVAPAMSFTYSTIGLGLSIAKVIENGTVKGSLTGVKIGIVTPEQKLWRSLGALGDITFAYSYSMILLEIQDTIKSPPAESKTMNKAAFISVTATTIFYILCGCFGYAAMGDLIPENLLSGFGFYSPYWLIDIANVAIVIHLVGLYQVCCQPIFSFIERHAALRFPNSFFFNGDIDVPNLSSKDQPYKFNPFKLVWRLVFVIVITLISMLIPFFNSIVGLVGAIGYWPITVYFPLEMYIVQNSIPKWSTKWMLLTLMSVACLIISTAATIGSVVRIVDNFRSHQPFKTNY